MVANGVARSRKVPVGRLEWERRFQARKLKGQAGFLPRAPIAEHVRRLHAWGLPLNSIAAAAGVGAQTVHDVVYANNENMQVEVFFRLRSVSYKPVPEQDGHKVLSIGAQRRLCALRRLGYSTMFLRDELRCTVSYVMNAKSITYAKWCEISDLYDRLSMTAGPSPKTATIAASRGWPGPLDWESVDIDDPDAVPLSDKNVGSAMASRAAVAQGLLAQGLSVAQVAERMGVTTRSVERWKLVPVEAA